jgi:Acetyltransferase (GNAT) domain
MRHTVLTSFPDADLAARWNTSIAEMPFATHYVTPNYFSDPYVSGERFAVLAEDEDRTITAVVTGVIENGRIISGLFSRPQMVFRTGTDVERAFAELVEGVKCVGGVRPEITEMHSWVQVPGTAPEGMHQRQSNEETSVVVLDLSLGTDNIFAGFSQTRRNEIRRATKQGAVEIKEMETDNELVELYSIYCDWNERKGNRPDSFEKLEIAAGQRANRRIFIAKADKKVVAGSFYRFCPGGMVEYAANFSMPEHQRLRPNDLIGWHAIRWAVDSSCRYFSMGGSHLFLRRFGGETWTTYQYRNDSRSLGLSTIKENVRDLSSAAFKRLPTAVKAGVRRVLAG